MSKVAQNHWAAFSLDQPTSQAKQQPAGLASKTVSNILGQEVVCLT